MRKTLFVIAILCMASTAFAYGHLSAKEIGRLRVAKALTADVDTKSLEVSIRELESTDRPDVNLDIRVAMAKTYADIVRDQKLVDLRSKTWLYSMVSLNMAYLQFGGTKNPEPLNRVICRKLKEYLPEGLLKTPGFIKSLD